MTMAAYFLPEWHCVAKRRRKRNDHFTRAAEGGRVNKCCNIFAISGKCKLSAVDKLKTAAVSISPANFVWLNRLLFFLTITSIKEAAFLGRNRENPFWIFKDIIWRLQLVTFFFAGINYNFFYCRLTVLVLTACALNRKLRAFRSLSMVEKYSLLADLWNEIKIAMAGCLSKQRVA